jgi:alkylhydroperoxidase family enzyme
MLPLLVVLAAGFHNVNLPKLFSGPMAKVESHTSLPVLLPQRFPNEFRRLFASGSGHPHRWRLSLRAAPNCGADVCFVADFTARRKGRPAGSKRVRLARGRTGFFTPRSCGGPCAPPTIEWRERHATFSIQANVPDPERRRLIAMANSAIRHGPRLPH